MDRKWRSSLGVQFTTTPRDITEEVRIRVPAGDFHVLRNLNHNVYLDSRLLFQVLQNHGQVGVRWAHAISPKLSFSLGDDVTGWFGFLTVSGFNNKAYGFENYPNVSVGYRLKSDLLFTFKTEALLSLYSRSFVGSNVIDKASTKYNGLGFTLALEQPFYNKKYFTLGFQALYTDFNWQFWPLYSTFDRRIFYPQLIFGFIL